MEYNELKTIIESKVSKEYLDTLDKGFLGLINSLLEGAWKSGYYEGLKVGNKGVENER